MMGSTDDENVAEDEHASDDEVDANSARAG